MANISVQSIIEKIKNDFGQLKKVGNGNTLFLIESINTLIYFRYSKITPIGKYTKAFYGLREKDIKLLQGKKAFICFVTDNPEKTILIPFGKYEDYFSNVKPSSGGQCEIHPDYYQMILERLDNNGKIRHEHRLKYFQQQNGRTISQTVDLFKD